MGLPHPAAGVRDEGGVRLGRPGGRGEKAAGLLPGEFFDWEEGLCVQCLHLGPYEEEPATLAAMEAYAGAEGFAIDLGGERLHHEIYLSDPRRCRPERRKTVLRQPVKRLAL